MNRSLRVVLVGCGNWGRNLLRVLSQERDLQIVAVIDIDAEARAAALDLVPGIRVESSLLALRHASPDAVFIASPGPLHACHAEAALESGAHVFVEKPMATSVADAASLVQRARELRRIGMVGHLLHYHPAAQAMLELIRGGDLGRPLRVASQRCALKGSREVDGSVLWSLAPHDVSLFLAIDGSTVRRLAAQARNEGRVVCLELETMRGLQSKLLVSRASDLKLRRTRVLCERGIVLFDETSSNGLLVWREGATEPESLSFACAHKPLQSEIQAFLRCVRTDTQPQNDFSEGLTVVSILAQARSRLESCPRPHARSEP